VVDVTDAGADFELTRRFARSAAEVVAGRGDFTLEHRKSKRRGRLFLDILRNGPASHAVAPWSLRPLPGAPVAVPLDWDEALASSFQPRRITLANVFRRLASKPDPWADHPAPAATIASALHLLEAG
jgi:bifunctional non-homologous end joining protein LigD